VAEANDWPSVRIVPALPALANCDLRLSLSFCKVSILSDTGLAAGAVGGGVLFEGIVNQRPIKPIIYS